MIPKTIYNEIHAKHINTWAWDSPTKGDSKSHLSEFWRDRPYNPLHTHLRGPIDYLRYNHAHLIHQNIDNMTFSFQRLSKNLLK